MMYLIYLKFDPSLSSHKYDRNCSEIFSVKELAVPIDLYKYFTNIFQSKTLQIWIIIKETEVAHVLIQRINKQYGK